MDGEVAPWSHTLSHQASPPSLYLCHDRMEPQRTVALIGDDQGTSQQNGFPRIDLSQGESSPDQSTGGAFCCRAATVTTTAPVWIMNVCVKRRSTAMTSTFCGLGDSILKKIAQRLRRQFWQLDRERMNRAQACIAGSG